MLRDQVSDERRKQSERAADHRVVAHDPVNEAEKITEDESDHDSACEKDEKVDARIDKYKCSSSDRCDRKPIRNQSRRIIYKALSLEDGQDFFVKSHSFDDAGCRHCIGGRHNGAEYKCERPRESRNHIVTCNRHGSRRQEDKRDGKR